MEMPVNKMISQRCYPQKEFKKEYAQYVQDLNNKELRILLKIVLCCGFRISEIYNSFIFENDSELFIKGLAGKSSRITHNKIGKQGFVGAGYLNLFLRKGVPVFKSVRLMNIFNLDIDELEDYVSTPERPKWIGQHMKSYIQQYRLIKKSNKLNVQYKSNILEESIRIEFNPSFHFFRKLFSSELAEVTGRESKVVDYMRWQEPKMLFTYVKNY